MASWRGASASGFRGPLAGLWILFRYGPKVGRATLVETVGVVRNTAIIVCGLIALMTPLLLWTAWSPTMFWLIIVVGCTAILAIFLLIRWWPHERF